MPALALLLCAFSVSGGSTSGAPLPLQVVDGSAGALSAAMQIFDGIDVSDCLSGNNPSRQQCVTVESTPENATRGIAVFGISDAGQNGGFSAALGQTADGDWKLWFTSQNPYQLTRLPGDMVVCSGGDGVNLRSGPSSDADRVGGYADGARVTGEQFVLTDPVDPGNQGYGWFRISAPDAGWLYSKFLENAALGDNCALHDAQVG